MAMDAPVTRPKSPSEEIEFLRSQSLTTVLQREIERMILSGELAAGERINENLLASKLAVSRGPIREACRKLEQAGMLEIFVNRGMFVRKLGLKEALDIYDVRAVLAELAGQLAARRARPADVDALAGLVDRMDAAVAAEDMNTYYPMNLQFHIRVMELTGNDRLASVYIGMDKELHLFRRRSLVSHEGLRASNAEHRAIVEAIGEGDARRAGRLMRRHIEAGKKRAARAAEAAGAD